MRVQDLLNYLEDCDPEAEVRIAQQPSWPFECTIDSSLPVISAEEAWGCEYDADESEPEEAPNVVWLAEGGQVGYLPGAVSRALGWR